MEGKKFSPGTTVWNDTRYEHGTVSKCACNFSFIDGSGGKPRESSLVVVVYSDGIEVVYTREEACNCLEVIPKLTVINGNASITSGENAQTPRINVGLRRVK